MPEISLPSFSNSTRAIYSQFSGLTRCQSRERLNPGWSFEKGAGIVIKIVLFVYKGWVWGCRIWNESQWYLTRTLDGNGHFTGRSRSTVGPRYHCLRFQILHTIYSRFTGLTNCQSRERLNPEGSFENGAFIWIKIVLSVYKVLCCVVLNWQRRSMISKTHFRWGMDISLAGSKVNKEECV